MTTLSYDNLGNIASVMEPGNNAATTITTSFGYTTDGTYNQPDLVGQPITVTDNATKTTHLRYDARGNLSLVQDALGNQTAFAVNLADQVQTATYPNSTTGMPWCCA